MIKRLPCGRYEVRLARHTLWLWPTFPQNGAQPLWCALFEKAVSILRGGFQNMGPATVQLACELLFGTFQLLTGKGMPIAVLGPFGGQLHSVAAVEIWDLHL
jgi:hypothetical protein